MAPAKNGSLKSRTTAPMSIVGAPRSPRASGFGPVAEVLGSRRGRARGSPRRSARWSPRRSGPGRRCSARPPPPARCRASSSPSSQAYHRRCGHTIACWGRTTTLRPSRDAWRRRRRGRRRGRSGGSRGHPGRCARPRPWATASTRSVARIRRLSEMVTPLRRASDARNVVRSSSGMPTRTTWPPGRTSSSAAPTPVVGSGALDRDVDRRDVGWRAVGLDRDGCPGRARRIDPMGQTIGGHDVGRAPGPAGTDDELPDRAGTDDRDAGLRLVCRHDPPRTGPHRAPRAGTRRRGRVRPGWARTGRAARPSSHGARHRCPRSRRSASPGTGRRVRLRRSCKRDTAATGRWRPGSTGRRRPGSCRRSRGRGPRVAAAGCRRCRRSPTNACPSHTARPRRPGRGPRPGRGSGSARRPGPGLGRHAGGRRASGSPRLGRPCGPWAAP